MASHRRSKQAQRKGQAQLGEHLSQRSLLALPSLLVALQHAQRRGATRVQFLNLHTLSFVAYRPAPAFPGRWGQSVYCEVDGKFITDRYWVLHAGRPGREAEELAVLLREEQSIMAIEREAKALNVSPKDLMFPQ